MNAANPTSGTTAVVPAAAVRSPASPKPARLDGVDLLRGMVMVLMALDHTRVYLHWSYVHGFQPLDLGSTTPAVFFTRWITHFCAPVFVFLAGTGAFLSGTRGKSKRELSWFLVTRGAWLIFLELTLLTWGGWAFRVDLHLYVGVILWALGWSMIVLAGLIHLRLWIIAAFGIALIAGHNAFDAVKPEAWGALAPLWVILHTGGPVQIAPGYHFFAVYPLVPWVGVMAAGYAFGSILLREREARRQWVLRAGIVLTAAFILLRWSNIYGNPSPWTEQSRASYTLLSFLDCAKYPPSLLFLLMTLGPALILLSLVDRETTPAALKPIVVFGRAPMFYYLLHIFVIHGLALLIETFRFGSAPWLFGLPFGPREDPVPASAGMGLIGVYAVTALAVALLYPVCRWFAGLKRRRSDVWLSYL